MEELTGILAVTFIFGGATVVFLATSPIGRAIADRIRGGPAAGGDEVKALEDQVEALTDEMETMRAEFTDVQERLDFTERLLARGSEGDREEPARVQD